MDNLCQDSPIDSATRRSIRDELPATLRALYASVLAATLASGSPVNPSALVAVLATHYETCDVPLRFTGDHVSELLWFAIHEFCEDRSLIVPTECAAALHAVLDAAATSEVLSRGSDAPTELFRALEGLHAS